MTTSVTEPTTSVSTRTGGRGLSFLTSTPGTGDAVGYAPQGVVELFELAEALGYDRGWLRQDDEEPSAASIVMLLSAISPRTQAVGLGAVMLGIDRQIAPELATALVTLDALSAGRVHAGIPTRAGRVEDRTPTPPDSPDDGWPSREQDSSWVARVCRLLAGSQPGQDRAPIPLGERVWCVAEGPASARWAAELGLNLLSTDVFPGPVAGGFAEAERAVLSAYRDAAGASGRTAVARTLLPTDSASSATRAAYAARTAQAPGGDPATSPAQHSRRRTDAITGSSCQILEQLAADPAVSGAGELVVLLPLDLQIDQRAQILHDVAAYIAPELGFGIVADVGTCGESDERQTFSLAPTPLPPGAQAA